MALLFVASVVALALAYQFPGSATIDVGSGSDTAFIRGFSFRENLASGGDFRWSGPSAEIRFWGVGDQDGTLVIRIAGPRPSGQAHYFITANGQAVSSGELGAGFTNIAVPVSRGAIGAGGDLIVTLPSDAFTQPPDDRELGLQVDSARFESRGWPVLPSPRALYLALLPLLFFWIGNAWTGSSRVAIGVAVGAILAAVIAVAARRVEAIWFALPLFWFMLALAAAAWLFGRVLMKVSLLIDARAARLVFAAMLLAFVLRMVFAVGPGFIVDTQDYVVWSYKTVVYGLGSAYQAIDGLWIADQSPGLVYILHAMGWLYHAIFSPDFLYPGIAGDPLLRGLTTNPAALADPVQRTLLRMPSLLCDLATGALVFAAARRRLSERAAWLVALAYWFNPAVLWNGAYWGQTDAIPALMVLAAFLLVENRRLGLAFFIMGAGIVTKPQAAVFAPLLLVWAIKQTVEAEGWHWRGLLTRLIPAALAGTAGLVLVLAPMILAGGLNGMLAYFGDTVGHHPILSANAHNLWWFLKAGQIDVPDTLRVDPNFPLSYRTLSLALFGAVYLAALVRAWLEERADWYVLGAFVGFCFFFLPTEIHENYGYSLIALLAVAMSHERKWIPFYIAVSATMVANYALSDPPVFSLLGVSDPDVQLALARQLNALANTLLFALWGFAALVWRGRVSRAAQAPAVETARA